MGFCCGRAQDREVVVLRRELAVPHDQVDCPELTDASLLLGRRQADLSDRGGRRSSCVGTAGRPGEWRLGIRSVDWDLLLQY